MKLDVLHQVVGKTNIRYSADDLLDAHAIFEYFYGENTSTTSFQPPR